MAPFPHDEAEFAADARISWDKQRNCYILEENGREWMWVASVNKWTEAVSEPDFPHQLDRYHAHEPSF
jgi:hypothetical protein